MFKNARIFRLNQNDLHTWRRNLAAALEGKPFKPVTAMERSTIGWVKPVAHATSEMLHQVGLYYLLTLRTEQRLLPGGVVKQATAMRAREIEEEQGYKPGRRQMKEIKERVADELLPKAFTQYRDTRVLVDAERGLLAIDAASPGRADEVLGMLAKTLDSFPVETIYTAQSPIAAMTQWITEDDAPEFFTIDQDADLEASGGSHAKVQYRKHTVDTDDARRHIQSGKQCTRLAMTWADRISFVLDEGLVLKRIQLLDVLRENVDALATSGEEKFDSDFVLFAGEFGKLTDDLLDALGGERKV